MEYLEINPILCELFKAEMLSKHWEICHQDAGQTHLVGWGYEITWHKSNELVILRYSDKQGVASALIEVSKNSLSEIQALLKDLNE